MSHKCFISHLVKHLRTVDGSLFLRNEAVQFVWIQGVIVDIETNDSKVLIDDGTDILIATAKNFDITQYHKGDYVLVQGVIVVGEDSNGLKVIIIDADVLSVLPDPMMETLWFIELSRTI
jgi:hypothetical protein